MECPAKPVRPTSIPAPVDLVATPSVSGDATLGWKRNGAPGATSYVVETSEDGLIWAFARVTTRMSVTLSGFKAGVPAWFRVTATRADLTSNPSSVASIYAPIVPALTLKVV